MALQLGFVAAISLTFGLLFWIMIFIQTCMHFPKMEPRKRLMMSLGNASSLSLALIILVLVSLWLLDSVIGWSA